MKLRDTRGKESITLTLCTMAILVLMAKFAFAGLTVVALGTFPVIGAGEFGIAFAALIAPWLQREWTEKTKVGSNAKDIG